MKNTPKLILQEKSLNRNLFELQFLQITGHQFNKFLKLAQVTISNHGSEIQYDLDHFSIKASSDQPLFKLFKNS